MIIQLILKITGPSAESRCYDVENPHFSNDGVMRDVIDGKYFCNHPIFSKSNDALQLFGYYDDLELVNPGSKSNIHKIGK